MSYTVRNWGRKLLHRRLRAKYRRKALQLRDGMEKAFTRHPETTGETYLQHLWFTVRMAVRFVYTTVVLLLHGVFPFLCVRTASTQIERIYRIMKMRLPVARREEIDREIHTKGGMPRNGDARIAIIGGGFSGALVLANLVELAEGNISIEWFESSASPGTGIAYGTSDPTHLLNVPAGRIGAFAGRADDFYLWLQTDEGKEAAQKICPQRAIAPDSFLPRMLYGEYLRGIVRTSLEKARTKDIQVHLHRSRIVDAALQDTQSQQLVLSMDRGGVQKEFLVDAVALATGNLPPRSHGFQAGLAAGNSPYVEDLWNTPPDHVFPHRLQELSADAEVVIIGTGLTMVDAVLTLKSHGFKGTVTAISRNGWMPLPHASCKPYPAWEWVLAPQFAPRTAFALLKCLREEIARAEAQGYDWRAVIDSLRPVTQTLWKQLGTAQKRKFLGRLMTLWNVHRHRMAPEIHLGIKAMRQSGALKIVAGKIYYVGGDKDGMTVAYRKRCTNRMETLRPALVINCTGPEYDIAASSHALLKNMRDRELVTVGPLRFGIEATLPGGAKGKAPDAIFPLGTLLVGESLECTAVPELRDQAHETAVNLLQRIKALYEPEYKAALAMGAAI